MNCVLTFSFQQKQTIKFRSRDAKKSKQRFDRFASFAGTSDRPSVNHLLDLLGRTRTKTNMSMIVGIQLDFIKLASNLDILLTLVKYSGIPHFFQFSLFHIPETIFLTVKPWLGECKSTSLDLPKDFQADMAPSSSTT